MRMRIQNYIFTFQCNDKVAYNMFSTLIDN